MIFDQEAADRAEYFFENFLVHTKGRSWSGKPFVLSDWERQIVRDVFGTKREDGTRQYRLVYIEIPRKNGKSTFAAGIALYLLFADKEPGAEVYSCAADREQAAIVFDVARSMVEASPALSKRARLYRRSIVYPHMASSYRVLSADVPTKHGLNASGVIFDELHAQPNRDLWDVMVTATGAREQPLVVALTTAGFDKQSICWEVHEYAEKVSKGIIDDPSFYGVIYAADETDDWESPEVWKKANPGLGETVKLDYLEQECARAREIPAYQNTFRRLHLNQWTSAESRWIDLGKWDASAGMIVPEKLKGRRCYLGVDLSSTQDITAIVQVFPDDDRYIVVPHFFIPQDNALQKQKRDRVPYTSWAKRGFVHLTPGNTVDYAFIERKIDEIAQEHKIVEIAYDRWNADYLIQRLMERGMNVVPVGMGYASMNAPCKFLETLILERRLVHGAHPVLRWMADNVVIRQDPAGNIKPDKAKSTQRIDGIVALVLALSRAMTEQNKESVYKRRGILVV